MGNSIGTHRVKLTNKNNTNNKRIQLLLNAKASYSYTNAAQDVYIIYTFSSSRTMPQNETVTHTQNL